MRLATLAASGSRPVVSVGPELSGLTAPTISLCVVKPRGCMSVNITVRGARGEGAMATGTRARTAHAT